MTAPGATLNRPDDVPAYIAQKLRWHDADRVTRIGEQTGWWTADDVDWAMQGREGPRPARWTLEEEPPTAAPAPGPRPASPVAVLEPVVERSAVPASAVEQPVVLGDEVPVGDSGYVTALSAVELFVDDSYQRPLDVARVRRMAAAWAPRMVGTLDVSDRGDAASPRFAIVNGQHRWAAARTARGDEVWLAVTVHEGLDVAGEARLMHELDRTTKKLSGHEKWRARRGAGDARVRQVEAIAARHGLRVDASLADGVLRSYGAAEKLLAVGGEELLDHTLAVLGAAYGVTAAGYMAPLLTGVGQLLHEHGKTVDIDRLSRALAGVRPEQLRATATSLRDVQAGTLAQLFTRAIARQYDRTAGTGPRLAGGRA